MSETMLNHDAITGSDMRSQQILELLKRRFESAARIRTGLCLLNSGQYEQAEAVFRRAGEEGNLVGESLPAYLAACLMGQGRGDDAASLWGEELVGGSADTATRVRHALTLSANGKINDAIQSLRDGIREDPESAELHFQLGTLLASVEQCEEAELRFTQALNIDRNHAEAMISLALCFGVRGSPGEALAALQRAQRQRPHDPRIGLLIAQAARAAQQQGHSVHVRTCMFDDDSSANDCGIEELADVIASDPDFVDAFLAIPVVEVDESIFTMLLETIERALERQVEHAELHFHCGRVLERLGRNEDAIEHSERAVAIDPKFTRALIELGKLYHKTDRRADATTRLEQAVDAGAEYADVYYLLGNLYRDQGQVSRARTAYRHALVLNHHYEAASKALRALPV